MSDRPSWTFITSHGSILLEVAREPNATVREIASGAGVTERQAHRVLADLAEEGYIVRERVGRRNRYRVQPRKPMRHPSFADRQIGELLAALKPRTE
jgi:predicted ArsR family transcriptional regulator